MPFFAMHKILLMCCAALSCSVMSDTLQPHGLQPARLLCPWDSPGKNTTVGCHALLQGIFPTQGSNPGLPHYRWILFHLSHQGSLLWWLSGKESAYNAGNVGLIPESGSSLGVGNSNLLQYSCLGNSMDRGDWGLKSMGSQRVRRQLSMRTKDKLSSVVM